MPRVWHWSSAATVQDSPLSNPAAHLIEQGLEESDELIEEIRAPKISTGQQGLATAPERADGPGPSHSGIGRHVGKGLLKKISGEVGDRPARAGAETL
jgi:hypothetical protein